MPLPPAYLVKTSSAATYTALYIWMWNQPGGPQPPLGDYELRPLSEVPVGTAWSATEQTQWFYTAGRRLSLPASGDASRSVERIYTGTGLIQCIAPFLVTRDVMAAITEGGRVIRVGGTVTAPTLTLMPAGTPVDTGSTGATGATGSGATGPTGPTEPSGALGAWTWLGENKVVHTGEATLVGGNTLKLSVTDADSNIRMAEMDEWGPGTVLTLTEGAHVATFTVTRVAASGTNRNITGTWAGTPAAQFTSNGLMTVSVGAAVVATKVQKVHAGGNAAAATIMAGGVAARKIYAGSTLVWEA